MFGVLRRTLQITISSSKAIQPLNGLHKFFHLLSISQPQTNLLNKNCNLLQPTVPNLIFNCGFKVKGRLRRRCKDCYYVRRKERLYIICETHPRHKQMSMIKKEHNTWMLSHATQSKIRPF
ncbi:uncharacterized protein LOC123298390 [Chrysoperla carnea]|uniref:uncharacterized protein LOC123298390 n=1 Tax=Chrysoperla carnea TaxID=189513 RepID=UPI001D07665B|nr:uncharacterized protein LOC123298390 [Chrysoperla carnea]